jgi:hypothetical protein
MIITAKTTQTQNQHPLLIQSPKTRRRSKILTNPQVFLLRTTLRDVQILSISNLEFITIMSEESKPEVKSEAAPATPAPDTSEAETKAEAETEETPVQDDEKATEAAKSDADAKADAEAEQEAAKKKKEASEELTMRLQKLALERQKVSTYIYAQNLDLFVKK